jgi:hypothetical protein
MARVSIIQELVDAGDVGQSDAILPRGNDARPSCAGRSSGSGAWMDSTRSEQAKKEIKSNGKMRWVVGYLPFSITGSRLISQSTNIRNRDDIKKTQMKITRQ